MYNCNVEPELVYMYKYKSACVSCRLLHDGLGTNH